jgi:predicted RNA-binding Zn-ribbon protein involved in translation (DUF1610 family)
MKNKMNLSRQSRYDFDETFEKLRTRKSSGNENGAGHQKEKHGRVIVDTQDFKCRQCGAFVSADRALSGVNNRNHCPLCLWSRHVDRDTPGDRKATCKSRMQPLGLTVKHTLKRYTMEKAGELMLIHHCTGCGKHSINRIAADDPQAVYQLFRRSLALSEETMSKLNELGILLLGSRDLTVVYSQLYGWQSILEEFQPAPEEESAMVKVVGAIPFSVEAS